MGEWDAPAWTCFWNAGQSGVASRQIRGVVKRWRSTEWDWLCWRGLRSALRLLRRRAGASRLRRKGAATAGRLGRIAFACPSLLRVNRMQALPGGRGFGG